jgi:dolichol-phosphate mannosyltransferase
VTPPEVSVIVPTYNEADSIVALVTDILRSAPHAGEVVLVDDDSPDGTAARAREAFSGNARVRVIVRTTDRGFAKSIRTGIEAARAPLVLVMDSDFNHDPSDIPRLVGVSPYADIVSGSRFAPGGNMPDRSRYLASLLYNFAIRIVLRTQVQDNLCGFFVMRRELVLALPLDAIFFGFGDYFYRLIHFAQRRRYSIIEIPIVLGARRAGTAKSRAVRVFAQYTIALIRFRAKLGRPPRVSS